jgi:hypothetical protein
MSIARAYLEEKIGPLLGAHAREGVLEYLGTFNPELEQAEMLSYLEELLGKNPKYKGIVKQYALMSKNLSRTSAAAAEKGAPTQTKKASKQTAKEEVQKGGDCNCMATKHPIFGSCIGCGKIFCVNYSLKQCNFCSRKITPSMSAETAESKGLDEETVAAYRQKVTHFCFGGRNFNNCCKDKLMKFDREHAKRTEVRDTQVVHLRCISWVIDIRFYERVTTTHQAIGFRRKKRQKLNQKKSGESKAENVQINP